MHKVDEAAIPSQGGSGVAEMEKDGAWSRGLWQKIQEIK